MESSVTEQRETRIEKPSDILSVCFGPERTDAPAETGAECATRVVIELDPEQSELDAYDYDRAEAFGVHHLVPANAAPKGKKARFRCEICGKEFAFRSRLHEHEKIHFDVRLFACKVCGKAFVTKTNLVHHSRIHSGDRPYKCDVCGRHFNRSDVLRIHWKRKHSESRPYECDVCRKSFAMKYLLQTHVKIHLDERPYACDVCGRGFVTRSNMTQHSKTHGADGTGRKKKT